MGRFFVLYFVFLLINIQSCWAQSNNAFNLALYEDVLDSELCERQLTYIRNDATFLRTLFMDASWRIPRGITKGNLRDTGNYFNCLEISADALDSQIEGKYCAVHIPTDQNFELPTVPVFPNITWPDLNITWPEITWSESLLELPWEELNSRTTTFDEDMKMKFRSYERARQVARHFLGVSSDDIVASRTDEGVSSLMSLELAVCIPKTCTPRQAVDFFTNNLTSPLTYTEQFCRLPNDKTWVAADTVAVVLFTIIGLIIILSTAYDVRHSVILERDPKQASKIYQSFSVFTNTKQFFVFPSGPNVVTCLDGIRSIAMIWVIVGHTFLLKIFILPENILDMFLWVQKFSSLWITSAPITVDTFFLLTGLLVVYTTASKLTKRTLLKNLHLFYLNRLLRMFPVLAVSILLVASFLHRTADGPYFNNMAVWVNDCRAYWWSTLLYVQNFTHPNNTCLPHTWYLAIDMQLYILSPIVLVWVLGKNKRISWLALGGALVAILIASSVYNFIHNFKSAVMSLARDSEERYNQDYYIHTLPRASPFFVGMIFGYLLHIYRGKKINMPLALVLSLWVVSLTCTTLIFISTYWTMRVDWDNQLLDNILNSYQRPLWGACVGWIIFACHKGYGGPINWILSLHVFKILGRLSYAMYILHYPLQFLVDSTQLTPYHFRINFAMYAFLIDFCLSVISAFLVTIAIDMPFTNLIKIALEGKRINPPPMEKPVKSKEDPEADFKSISLSNGLEKRTNM